MYFEPLIVCCGADVRFDNQEIRQEDHTLFERGRGNVCSVEFNCLYRWHATTSVEDEQWVHQVFSKIFPGKAPEQVSIYLS